ncbi:hypothetical protein LTR70_008813 [Exophiala xenobiotica]|uniref:C2H2-type domain-containing protein n=1 Tax=Lithohypha guttulata TaxID=1690604 RepID=A0ABR0JYC7_9EURO|nr:hypothetical protein LTR24_008977 [Lithohypha guttulata]KAK5311391.1 hypothetical protein LTR70_008813 [Exophiala xenobiotica]
MPRHRNPNSKTPYDPNRKKYQPVTRYGCGLCPDFHCRYKVGVNCSLGKHFRDQHPEVIDWQQHIVTWGKRFFNGDGTSHDASWTELEKHAVCIDDDDDDDRAEDEVMGKQDGEEHRSTTPQASTGPGKNVQHAQSRVPAEGSTRLAGPSRSIASFPQYPTLSFQARAQAQSLSYQPEAPSTPASSPTINPALLTRPAPLQIGPIDQWILNGQYDRYAPFLQHLARKVLLPTANDMRSRDERQRDEDQYRKWLDAVMEFEARNLNFPQNEWPAR